MNRPASINLFEKFFIAAVAIQFVRMTVNWDAWAAINPNPGVKSGGIGVLIFGAMASTVLWLLLWYYIVRRASNVAKWIYVVLVALLTISTIIGLANPLAPRGLDRAVGLVILALQLFATGLLFRNDAATWLQNHGANADATIHKKINDHTIG